MTLSRRWAPVGWAPVGWAPGFGACQPLLTCVRLFAAGSR